MPFLITPSISPVYLNNPGFTALNLSDENEIKVQIHSLQLQYYLLSGYQRWTVTDPNIDYGIVLDSKNNVVYDFVTSLFQFGKYYAYMFGFDNVAQTVIGLFFETTEPKSYMVSDLCDMEFYMKSDTSWIGCT